MFEKVKKWVESKLVSNVCKVRYTNDTIALIKFQDPDMNLAVIVNHTNTKNIIIYYLDKNNKLYAHILANYESSDHESIINIIDKAIIDHNKISNASYIEKVYYQQEVYTY